MIKEILKSRLLFGYVINSKVYKKPYFVGKGLKSFKVDKRSDGWIEIRDNSTNEKWAIFKRYTLNGALYLGFGLSKKPFAYYIPNKKAKEDIKSAVKEIEKKFRFLKISYKLASKTAKYYYIDCQIVDLFRFLNYLKPLPNLDIIDKIIYEKIDVSRKIIYYKKHYVLFSNCKYLLKYKLKGKNVYKYVLFKETFNVLRAFEYRYERKGLKREVLGGCIECHYRSNYANIRYNLSVNRGLRILLNVWNKRTVCLLSNIQGKSKVLSTRPI